MPNRMIDVVRGQSPKYCNTRHVLCLLLGFSLLFIAACDQTRPIRIGANAWPGYFGLYYARDLDLLDVRHVQLVDFDSSEDVMRALRNRAIDAAAVTLDEALQLGASGLPFRIVMAFDISVGADALLGHEAVSSLQELRGKKIGVETSALGAYMLARILEQAELTTEEISLVHLPFVDHYRAFQQGRVDYVITFDPQRSQIMDLGAQVVFSSKQIPGEIVDVLVIHEESFQKKQKHLEHLIDRYFQGVSAIKADPHTAANILAPRARMEPEQVIAAWKNMELTGRERNIAIVHKGPGGLVQTLQRLQGIMLENKLLNEAIAVEALVDGRMLLDDQL